MDMLSIFALMIGFVKRTTGSSYAELARISSGVGAIVGLIVFFFGIFGTTVLATVSPFASWLLTFISGIFVSILAGFISAIVVAIIAVIMLFVGALIADLVTLLEER